MALIAFCFSFFCGRISANGIFPQEFCSECPQAVCTLEGCVSVYTCSSYVHHHMLSATVRNCQLYSAIGWTSLMYIYILEIRIRRCLANSFSYQLECGHVCACAEPLQTYKYIYTHRENLVYNHELASLTKIYCIYMCVLCVQVHDWWMVCAERVAR